MLVASPPALDIEAEVEVERSIRHELEAAAKARTPEQAKLAALAARPMPDWHWQQVDEAKLAAQAAERQPEWFSEYEKWRTVKESKVQKAPAAQKRGKQTSKKKKTEKPKKKKTEKPKKKTMEKPKKKKPAKSWTGRICKWCKKPLQVIGNRRKNGKDGLKDWTGRRFHKKCYKLRMEPLA
jgi:outer membrane biosynthesis protein TonB